MMGKVQALEFEVGSAIQMLGDLGIAILNLKFIDSGTHAAYFLVFLWALESI